MLYSTLLPRWAQRLLWVSHGLLLLQRVSEETLETSQGDLQGDNDNIDDNDDNDDELGVDQDEGRK